MVARTVGHDTTSQLPWFKLGKRVESSPKFECPTFLQILTFEKELLSGPLIERLASQDRCPMSMARNVPSRALHVRELNASGSFRKLDNRRRLGGIRHEST